MLIDTKTKRKILEKASEKGRFFQVEFIKKDGSIRKMNCKAWVENAFTYGKDNAKKNTCEGKENIYTVVDMDIENTKVTKGAFRNINLDTVVSVSAQGERILFK